jgi:hypothetical protein
MSTWSIQHFDGGIMSTWCIHTSMVVS